MQSNPVNTDTKGGGGGIESVCINGVSLLGRLNWKKCKGFVSPGKEQTVRYNEVFDCIAENK